MAGEKRTAAAPVKEQLFGEPYSFSFFQTVALLEKLHSGGTGLGKEPRPSREPVRFSVSPGFAFPPSDVAGLKGGTGEGAPTLEVAFLGLIGPSGVLPNWYNELALERRSQKDGALSDFFDIFQHRLLTMFYLAWKKYRLPIAYRPDAQDDFSFYLRCLMGLGTEGLLDKVGLPAESPMYCGGLLSRAAPTVAAVSATVSYYFGVAAGVDQFVERMITLGPEERSAIGRANSTLGVDTVCGSQVWECQTRFRLNIGPMPFESFRRFLPSGDLLAPLFSLVRYQVGIEYEFEVQVLLDRNEVPSCRLGVPEGGGGRLGWSTWLKSPGIPMRGDPRAVFQMGDVTGLGVP